MNDDNYLPPPPPPPPPGGEPMSGEKADSLIRLGARIIDGLILLIPSIVIAVIVGGESSFVGTGGGRAWFGAVVVTVFQWAYFVFMESKNGATIGKRVLNLQVYSASGVGPPTQDEAMKRNAFLFFGLIPTFLGTLASLVANIAIAITISNDSLGRGWHDNFAGGTRVVRHRT